MATHRAIPVVGRGQRNGSAPEQVEALRHQYRDAAVAAAPRVVPLMAARTGHLSSNTRPVRTVAWDLFGLNARQLHHIADLGFDAIVLNCLWERVQPEPNVWDWSRFEQYVEDAANAGLQLIFRGPLAAPFWMDESFGFRDHRGESSFHGVYGRVPSFWNREAQKRIDEFMARAWDALHLESFWAIEASIGQGGEARFQSVKFDSSGNPATEVPLWCFDPYALGAFRFAMRARYDDDLNQLNRIAGRRWKNWNEVMPAKEAVSAKYFGETLSWYQTELLRHIDGLIHRLQPHRRIVISHATSLLYRHEYWGSGAVELGSQLWDLGKRWAERYVDVRHFYYSLLTYQEDLQHYFAWQIARGYPSRAYAGVEYAHNAGKNAPEVKRFGCYGMICGVNDHLFHFRDGAPHLIISRNARILRDAIAKFNEEAEMVSPEAENQNGVDSKTAPTESNEPQDDQRRHIEELEEEYQKQHGYPQSTQDVIEKINQDETLPRDADQQS